jgi:hypothetical protein
MNTVISSNPESLRAAIAGLASVTVEAEYGEVCVEGSIATLAHHGSRSSNPAPCLAENGFLTGVDVIGVSHVDLDTLGGIMAVLGTKCSADSFWTLAAFVDVNGPHKLGESGASEADLARLYAFWAWSQDHRVFPPRDGAALDITAQVQEACQAIEAILAGDESMLAAGAEFKAAEDALNASSFRKVVGDVALRNAQSFCNHLYVTPEGSACAAVVSYNRKFRSITVSFATPRSQDDACSFVQGLWGPLAGGHKGIAGSPRGRKMTMRDAKVAAQQLARCMARAAA